MKLKFEIKLIPYVDVKHRPTHGYYIPTSNYGSACPHQLFYASRPLTDITGWYKYILYKLG